MKPKCNCLSADMGYHKENCLFYDVYGNYKFLTIKNLNHEEVKKYDTKNFTWDVEKPWINHYDHFIAAFKNDKIVGLCNLYLLAGGYYEINVQVLDSYKKQGIAKEILKEVFTWAQCQNKELYSGKFIGEGVYLKPVLHSLKAKYPNVKYQEN